MARRMHRGPSMLVRSAACAWWQRGTRRRSSAGWVGAARWSLTLASLAIAGVVPAVAWSAGTIAITADGDAVAWQTTEDVGHSWGLYLRHRRSTPAPITAWSYKHATLASGGTTFWAQHGAGTYDVQVCEYDPGQGVLTTCSNQVAVTWVTDANGHFVAIPAADPALETGTLALAASGAQLTWEVTGTLGQASGFMVVDDDQLRWVPPAARAAEWVPAGGWQPGTFEVSVCAYDHYRGVVGTCSSPVAVEVAINGFGQVAAVPQPDPADEVGTITTSLEGCTLGWQTTGTVGSTTGFMVLAQQDGVPTYGAAVARYAWPQQRARDLDDLAAGEQHVVVCAYDFHRNAVGTCSETRTLELAWGAGPECTPTGPAPGGEAPPPEDAAGDAGELDEAIAAGLVAWRTPDASGATCAGCHAPDGIDLAYPAYSRDDIVRRASHHLDTASAEAIADMIEALRDAHGWVPTLDPREHRPFQPGGQVLPGETAIERDAAFAQQLVDGGLVLAVGEVDDLETALVARDELLALDPWALPVGIPFDRYSEDEHFGAEHHAFAEWVPSLPHVATPEDPEAWWDLQDLYLGDPSDEALMDLLDALVGPDAVVRLAADDLRGGVEAFESARFRSVLLLGHEQRRRMAGGAPLGASDVRPYATHPVWEVGRRAYDTWACNPIHHGDPEACMRLPGFEPDASFFAQMERMSLGWHYAGFLLDPSLVDRPGEPSLLSGHYMSSLLKHRGYPSHNAFTRALRAVKKHWGPDQSWRSALYYATAQVPTSSASWDLVFMDHFMAQGGQGGHELLYGPAGGEHREAYVRWVANTYKMLLFLLEDEIARTGQVFGRDVLVEMLRAEADLRWYGPVDYLPVLVAHQPERAEELAAWIEGIADAAEQAQEVSLVPVDP